MKKGQHESREERSTSFISIATSNYGHQQVPAHQPPLSSKNARSNHGKSSMNITGDNADFFDTTQNLNLPSKQGQVHVVSSLNKKTPNCSIGSKVSRCRTIEEARMMMSND